MKYGQGDMADEPSGEQRAGGPLTKVSINLLPKTVRALDEVLGCTGDSKTECINRAVQVYAWLRTRMDLGDRFMVIEQDGTSRQIQMF